MHLITVYGTLKRGHYNFPLLADAEFIAEVVTPPQYTMLSLGAFPGIVEGGGTAIHGELFRVDDETLRDLDGLEGHPNWYERKPVRVNSPIGEFDAEIYVLPKDYNDGGRFAVVEDGVWK